MRTTRALGAALLILSAACSSESSTSQPPVERAPDPPPAPGPAVPPRAPPTFGTCPTGYATECAMVDVPLDHANAAGESIQIHIARHKASVPATRQIWLLSGGPGQAGDVFFAT